jgi:hypothetical protein
MVLHEHHYAKEGLTHPCPALCDGEGPGTSHDHLKLLSIFRLITGHKAIPGSVADHVYSVDTGSPFGF